MPRPDRASKTGVRWPRAWTLPTVSNVTLRWPITDQLALSSYILPRVTHAAIVWQPRGGPVYILNLVYKVNDILFKHVVIGQPENWVKLMNISNKTHLLWKDSGSAEWECLAPSCSIDGRPRLFILSGCCSKLRLSKCSNAWSVWCCLWYYAL